MRAPGGQVGELASRPRSGASTGSSLGDLGAGRRAAGIRLWLAFDRFSAVRDRPDQRRGSQSADKRRGPGCSNQAGLKFGHIVLGNTHRHPALLARMATTVDHIAGADRFVLGLGTGWLEADHRVRIGPCHRWPRGWRYFARRARDQDDVAAPRGASLAAPPYELREARQFHRRSRAAVRQSGLALGSSRAGLGGTPCRWVERERLFG